MCIVLLTTAHPKYALIILDNRDEFILRPTSLPHWWTTKASRQTSRAATPDPGPGPDPDSKKANGEDEDEDEVQHILSSRDLQRAERGTWLGITKSGHFAVLTNYRELDTNGNGAHLTVSKRSRGGMVTAWLSSPSGTSVGEFVESMLADGGCKGVGGFSLICAKLRKRRGGDDGVEPLAILSNRADHAGEVPWICGGRGEVLGLSNTVYDDPDVWPKVKSGKALLEEVVAEAAERDMGEDELLARLFSILDQDTLPAAPGQAVEEQMGVLKQSIFIPLIGDEKHQRAMPKSAETSKADPKWKETMSEVAGAERPDEQPQGPFETGMYGTQRQTLILVDHDGNVTYTERALWDANGNAIPRGEGDMKFRFAIDGWEHPTRGTD